MNRRNFFKDALSGIAAFLIPSIVLPESKEESKQIAMIDFNEISIESGSIKNTALYYEEGKYMGQHEFELPEHLRKIEADKAISRVLSSWEARLNNIPKPNVIRVNYRNKTC